jgi:type IV pilus assembly protein PilE
MTSSTRTRADGGFTLIELMVVVVIATILLSIAVPSYMSQVRQSRRTEAKNSVLELAGREERFFATNGVNYTAVAANLGYTALPAVGVGSGYYTLSVCTPAAAGCGGTPAPPATWAVPATPNYLVIAVPTAAQVGDNQCVAFFVDSTGKQMAVDSTGADATTNCWTR